MTPTLVGRLHTRAFVLAAVGLPWTLFLVLVTPLPIGGATLGWLILTGIGLVLWEPVYHLLQQFRWEKDWPIFFSLVTVVNEGLLTGAVLSRIVDVSAGLFALQLFTTWLFVWLTTIGPMRVLFLRWRYQGGEIL